METERFGCVGCRIGGDLPFSIVMAFQPIVDMGDRRVWGYEALVRGANGEGAPAILAQVTEDNRYRFDQLCRVTAIETAGRLFDAKPVIGRLPEVTPGLLDHDVSSPEMRLSA